MNMKLLNSAALAATLALALPALAAPPIIDSTGVKKTVVATMVPMTANEVKNIAGDTINNNGNGGSLPPGYREVIVPTGPHALNGSGGSYNSLPYYTALGYPIVKGSGCGGDLSPRVVETFSQNCTEQGCDQPTHSYAVCEPIGSRFTLEKVTLGEVRNFSEADVNRYARLPSYSVNTGTATAICQAEGYKGFTDGTVVGAYFNGSCRQATITQYRPGVGFVVDDLCYNTVLKSMQCYR